jgi:RecA/RadA recombinase
MLTRITNVDLIVIDSINNFYRKEIHEDAKEVNNKLVEQIKILNILVRRGVHIVVTSQVYNKFDEENVSFLGGKIIENFCKKIIELKKEPRCLIVKKPEKGNFNFEIVEQGIIKT